MDYIIASCAILYILMGVGVLRLWRLVVDEDEPLWHVVVILWPVVLIIVALCKRNWQ